MFALSIKGGRLYCCVTSVFSGNMYCTSVASTVLERAGHFCELRSLLRKGKFVPISVVGWKTVHKCGKKTKKKEKTLPVMTS